MSIVHGALNFDPSLSVNLQKMLEIKKNSNQNSARHTNILKRGFLRSHPASTIVSYLETGRSLQYGSLHKSPVSLNSTLRIFMYYCKNILITANLFKSRIYCKLKLTSLGVADSISSAQVKMIRSPGMFIVKIILS